MKKIIYITAFLLCVLLSSEKAYAEEKEIVMRFLSEDGSYAVMYDDFSIEFDTRDQIAVSNYRYKTIGITLTRNKLLIGQWGEKIYRNVYGNDGELQWLEFSLDSANVQVETTRDRGTEYNIWTIPGETVMRLLNERYPDWAEAIFNTVQNFKNDKAMGRVTPIHDTECIKLDSMMTVFHRKDGVDYEKGFLYDPGNGRVLTSGLVYTNTADRRCYRCDENSIFKNCLTDGYAWGDVANMALNYMGNERICYHCEGPMREV